MKTCQKKVGTFPGACVAGRQLLRHNNTDLYKFGVYKRDISFRFQQFYLIFVAASR